MSMRYRMQAINRDGGNGTAHVVDGMTVAVASPLAPNPDPAATNPEQLLALAWATCLNSTAHRIVDHKKRTAVRVEVELHDADSGPGFEFHVDTYLSVEGADLDEIQRVLDAAHARCPVSKLLHAAATARVHAELYSP